MFAAWRINEEFLTGEILSGSVDQRHCIVHADRFLDASKCILNIGFCDDFEIRSHYLR